MGQLLSNLPIGAKVKFGKHQINTETAQPIIWIVVDKNHAGYPANSVTLLTEKVIDLRAWDAKEKNSNDSTYAQYGNPNYDDSNIDQWLNSDGEAGKWYTARHYDDAAPSNSTTLGGTGYESRPGFLYHFTSAEKLALMPTTLVSQRGGDIASTVVSKVFLPSAWEILGTHGYVDGSSLFAGSTPSTARALVTEQLVTNTLCTSSTKPTSSSTYWKYWTRSTNGGTTIVPISDSGTSTYGSPYEGNVGIRPCANLTYNIKMSDTVDSDGCYTILTNTVPTIDGANGDLGQKNIAFTKTYTIDDADSDPITVTEYIDNVAIRSYVATLKATNTFSVTNTTWLKLTNGSHTLKIVASDGYSESVRTYTFVKKVNSLVVQRTTPIASATQPKSIIVSVVKNIPTEATFKVEACNNGFDVEKDVVWEDITFEVVNGEIHDFTNTVKTAGQWGVNVRVTVDRNGAEGACYITEIGGNFE